MKALLVAGGAIDYEFAAQYCSEHKFDFTIGIDKGTSFLYKAGITPDLLVGDFDSLDAQILLYYQKQGIEILQFNPEKDETDTQLALCTAIERGCLELELLGAMGTRIDHVIANIQILAQAVQRGAKAWMIDPHNRIHLAEKNETIKKSEQFGTYVSFFPLTTTVKGLTLKGFAYPLEKAAIGSDSSLTVSNEIMEETAFVSYEDGLLIMIESKD